MNRLALVIMGVFIAVPLFIVIGQILNETFEAGRKDKPKKK